ncbi:polysaccharide biosynthesis tyrosine autokinase [Sphingomonas sp. IC-56]|uniref:GumC family protein n=1 Tax=Sphingomonas sp. IC-56 TaxID=2898529 RepID=UPI001E3BF69A|nr:polysaccharide biosynthesis tyrosine autokinase [Sphingomonas sp. IC-56]MCD2323316.1 polysaccharide biosynthesis tyrosine autokinase [Sphingomonas sp. IC-56]
MYQQHLTPPQLASFEVSSQPASRLGPPILLQYWHIVTRWKWLIAGIIAAAVVAGLVITLLITPEYTASTRIQISRDQKNIAKVDGLESPESGRDLEFYQTQYSLLKARSLAERVARRLRLSANDAFFAAHGIKPSRLVSSPSGAANKRKELDEREKMAVGLLLNHVNVDPVRGSALVDVSYTSQNPELTAQIANAWAREYIAASIDRRFGSTADARRFLEGRLSDLRTKLEASERALVSYASNKNIVALSQGRDGDGKTGSARTLALVDLEALNTALSQAVADRVIAESRASTAGSVDLGALQASPAVSALRQRRAELQSEYAKLLTQFEPGYPAARALAEQIKVLSSNIAREEGRAASTSQGSRQSEYRAALKREQDLRQRVAALRAQFDTQQRDTIQYNIYQRDADTNRELYDALLQRYKEIGVSGVSANNLAIVDVAEAPNAPSSPNLPLNLAIALLAGIGLAGLAALGLEQIDEGLRDPSQVNRLLQAPLLGSVPADADEKGVAALADTKSAIFEAYLSIRSNLAFSTDHGVPRSFMVTSTRASEGKSTTSYALATVLARTGKRVLLIDADIRSPSGHEMMGATNTRGLTNFLAGDDALDSLIAPGAANMPALLSAGPPPPNAAELLSSDRLEMLVNRLVQEYDHVVIDSPPVLGLADAPLVARAVEGCIYVVEAEGVAVRGIKSALDRLRSVHANIFGVVLTKLHAKHAGYGYGYGYGDTYGGK